MFSSVKFRNLHTQNSIVFFNLNCQEIKTKSSRNHKIINFFRVYTKTTIITGLPLSSFAAKSRESNEVIIVYTPYLTVNRYGHGDEAKGQQ